MNIFIPGFLNEIQNVPFMKITRAGASDTNYHHQNDQGDCFYEYSSSSYSNSEYYDASNNSLSTTLFTLFLVVLSMEAIVLALCTIYSWCQLPTASQHGQTPEFWWIQDHVDDDEGEDSDFVSSALMSNNDDDYDEYNYESEDDENDETDWLISSIGSIGGGISTSRSRHRCNSPDRIESMIEERLWEVVCIERRQKCTRMRGSVSSGGSVIVDTEQDECCAICLNPYDETDTVAGSKAQSCRHLFHKRCLAKWLQRQTTCPCCRQEWLHQPTNYNSFASSFSVSSTRQLIQEQLSRRRRSSGSSSSFSSLNNSVNNLFSTFATTMISSSSATEGPPEDAILSSWRNEDTATAATTSPASSGGSSMTMRMTDPPTGVSTTAQPTVGSSNINTNNSNTEYHAASTIAAASWGGSGFCFFLS